MSELQIQRIPPRPAGDVYIIQMLDGRELELHGDGGLGAVMSRAGEDVSCVRSWYVIGSMLVAEARKRGYVA